METEFKMWTLEDGKEYLVVDQVIDGDNEYIYMIEYANPENVMICLKEDSDLTEIEDENEIKRIVKLLAPNILENIKNKLKD